MVIMLFVAVVIGFIGTIFIELQVRNSNKVESQVRVRNNDTHFNRRRDKRR